jgi:hypothetical protein
MRRKKTKSLSIHNADLKTLFTTITDKKKFYFLTAGGKLINTKKGYYDFHKQWFKEKNWEMPVEGK